MCAAILHAKAVPEMSGGMLNPTHSLSYYIFPNFAMSAVGSVKSRWCRKPLMAKTLQQYATDQGFDHR